MRNLSAAEFEYVVWGARSLRTVTRTIEELLVSKHLKIIFHEPSKKHLIRPGEKFDGTIIHKSQQLVIDIIKSHKEENENPETILLPRVTPLHLLDSINKMCSGKFYNFKSEYIIDTLKEKKYIKSRFGHFAFRTKAAKIEAKKVRKQLKELDSTELNYYSSVKRLLSGHTFLHSSFESEEGKELRRIIKKTNVNSIWNTLFNEKDMAYGHGHGIGE